MYVKTINQNIDKFPYSISELKKDNLNVSFPENITDEILSQFGVYKVEIQQIPEFNEKIEKPVLKEQPVFIDGLFVRVWDIVQLSNDELNERKNNIKNEIINATQQRLDDFAKTRNYDSILSACTYATSTNKVFATEGQRAVQLRDDTWQTLYNILGQVETQGRVLMGYADVEGNLPVLTWS